MITKNNKLKFIVLLGLILSVMSCTDKKVSWEEEKMTDVASCEGCHTNYEHLQEVFTPDSLPPASGCGGEAPHYEPYDRVYMGGADFEDFKKTMHYTVGCVSCHNGNDSTDNKTLAHSGDFLKHPSLEYDKKCRMCHIDISKGFHTSLHQGTGQKRKVTMRSGLSGPQDFDKLPQHQIEGYNNNCATCHGTCGNCHVVRPAIAGGGLSNSHMFNKTPDMVGICISCHTSRGGHAYLGVGIGTQPDVHLSKKGFDCLSCHDGAELHGNGEPVDQRYAYSELPTCEKCHSGLETANSYHSKHYDDFNCQVCHSQDYNNCGQCHINFDGEHKHSPHKGGAGAQIPAYMDFKIAANPIPDIKTGYEFVLVRRTLAAPENWDAYVKDAYPNFDEFPTYNYTTPHNILRWTDRTQVASGKSCSSECHIRNEEGVLVNKELYLFDENLLEWEKSASAPIVVDGKLPSSWTQAK